jgi:hypothetical protein
MATLAGKLMAEASAGQMERFDLMASLPQHRFPGGVACAGRSSCRDDLVLDARPAGTLTTGSGGFTPPHPRGIFCPV